MKKRRNKRRNRRRNPIDLMTAKGLVMRTLVNKSAWKQRAQRLQAFAERHNVAASNIGIAVNNSWAKPPASIKNRPHAHIGGTTYRHQVWAYVK